MKEGRRAITRRKSLRKIDWISHFDNLDQVTSERRRRRKREKKKKKRKKE